MTIQSSSPPPLKVLTGKVKSYEASGGGPKSDLFSFYLANDTEGADFQLRADAPTGMFAAMALIVATAYAEGDTQLQVTSFDKVDPTSNIYLVNLIRGG